MSRYDVNEYRRQLLALNKYGSRKLWKVEERKEVKGNYVCEFIDEEKKRVIISFLGSKKFQARADLFNWAKKQKDWETIMEKQSSSLTQEMGETSTGPPRKISTLERGDLMGDSCYKDILVPYAEEIECNLIHLRNTAGMFELRFVKKKDGSTVASGSGAGVMDAIRELYEQVTRKSPPQVKGKQAMRSDETMPANWGNSNPGTDPDDIYYTDKIRVTLVLSGAFNDRHRHHDFKSD